MKCEKIINGNFWHRCILKNSSVQKHIFNLSWDGNKDISYVNISN